MKICCQALALLSGLGLQCNQAGKRSVHRPRGKEAPHGSVLLSTIFSASSDGPWARLPSPRAVPSLAGLPPDPQRRRNARELADAPSRRNPTSGHKKSSLAMAGCTAVAVGRGIGRAGLRWAWGPLGDRKTPAGAVLGLHFGREGVAAAEAGSPFLGALVLWRVRRCPRCRCR